MQIHNKLIIAAVLLATTASSAMAHQWRCATYDRGHRAYVAVGGDLQWSMKKSFKNCLRNSPRPRSCTISASACVRTGGGFYPAHRCVVVDARGRSWAASGYHACGKAVHKCRAWHYHHGIPNGGICRVR